jgi:hypothetical protein
MLSNTLFEQLCEINNVLRMSVLRNQAHPEGKEGGRPRGKIHRVTNYRQ